MTTDDTSLAAIACRVLREPSAGSLASLDADGWPFASLVTVATDQDGAVLMLLSALARHRRNLDRDARASLLLVAAGGEGGDPLAGARLTVRGQVAEVTAGEAEARGRRRFLARHPEASGYAGFDDFTLVRLVPEDGHLVAGFGRIGSVAGAALRVGEPLATDFCRDEAALLAALNGPLVDGLAARAGGDAAAVAIDADGVDVVRGGRVARLAFGRRCTAVPSAADSLALLDPARDEGRR